MWFIQGRLHTIVHNKATDNTGQKSIELYKGHFWKDKSYIVQVYDMAGSNYSKPVYIFIWNSLAVNSIHRLPVVEALQSLHDLPS